MANSKDNSNIKIINNLKSTHNQWNPQIRIPINNGHKPNSIRLPKTVTKSNLAQNHKALNN